MVLVSWEFLVQGWHRTFRRTARQAEHQVQPLRRSDSNDSIWFGALAEEQLALVANGLSHEISFGWGLIRNRFSGTTGLYIPVDCRRLTVERAQARVIFRRWAFRWSQSLARVAPVSAWLWLCYEAGSKIAA